MNPRALVLALALAPAACGGKSTSVARPRPAPTPCPTDEALSAAAIAAWQQGPGEATATCAPLVVGGKPLWLLTGFLAKGGGDEESSLGAWTAIVEPGGAVVGVDGEGDVPWGVYEHTTGDEWTAADLDGDGDDELIDVAGYAHMGFDSTNLGVSRVKAGHLIAVGDRIDLSEDNSAAVDPDDPETGTAHSCTGTWSLVPAGREQHLAIELSGDGDCPHGRKVLRLAGDALVEVK